MFVFSTLFFSSAEPGMRAEHRLGPTKATGWDMFSKEGVFCQVVWDGQGVRANCFHPAKNPF